jgi:putative transposase
MKNHAAFFPGAQLRAQADHYARLRKRLQHKGTRSATRRLVVIAGRERRLKHERHQSISRQLVDAYPARLIGLEDLTDIRERVKRRHGKRASGKQRKANRRASQWAFAELHGYLAYKAVLTGSVAVKVDAYHTSQACPRCGYTSADNRPQKGLLFCCQVCHLVLHADLVGARASCQNALMCRTRKPKPCGGDATRSCGGVQTQAPPVRAGFLTQTTGAGQPGFQKPGKQRETIGRGTVGYSA